MSKALKSIRMEKVLDNYIEAVKKVKGLCHYTEALNLIIKEHKERIGIR